MKVLIELAEGDFQMFFFWKETTLNKRSIELFENLFLSLSFSILVYALNEHTFLM